MTTRPRGPGEGAIVPPSLLEHAERGPHSVGVASISVASPGADAPDRELATEIWYPAADAASGTRAAHPLHRPHAANAAATPAAGAYPLVVFSHGNSGMRQQSTFLTTHLASWGFVVAAPDHTGNTFFEMIRIRSQEERRRVHFEARRNRPADLSAVIACATSGDPRWSSIDALRIGVAGHSYGGWTAFKMPRRDPRVRAVCGLAPASEPFVGRKAFEADELPLADVATLVVAGIDDVLVDLETSVRPFFERLEAPRALIGIERADHFHFCDGVELLHTMHANNPRPNQPRRTKPYDQQLSEDRMHRSVRASATHFFHHTLHPRSEMKLNAAALGAVDPALRLLEAS
jgi:predicted dienelactone hydrolase